MLAKRLTRDGLTISGGMLGVILSAQVASASMPPAALSSTIQAVTLLAAGKTGAISPEVIALTEGVMKVMLMTKIKIATAILLTVVVAGTSMRAVAQASVVGPLAANGVRSGSAPRSTGAADPVSEGNPKLKTRGPSPASAEDLPAICRKMGVIKDRLKRASGGKQTQKLQKEVVVRLDEMIHELENREKKTPKMEDVLAELKLIRAMQNRINVRTAAWSNQYKGEQVPPPETIKDPKERQQFETIRQELKELAARQEKVATVTDALAKAKD